MLDVEHLGNPQTTENSCGFLFVCFLFVFIELYMVLQEVEKRVCFLLLCALIISGAAELQPIVLYPCVSVNTS